MASSHYLRSKQAPSLTPWTTGIAAGQVPGCRNFAEIVVDNFKTQRTVLFGDCDPGGVIYTPRIAHYVVEAVLEFQASRLGGPAAREIFEMNVLPPARSLSVEFMALLTWDDPIELEVACIAVGTTSFSCEVTARREDGKVAFVGRITQVCISPRTRRPVVLPDRLRLALTGDDA